MNGQLAAGFADLDTGRKERTGFAEVVFCQGKEDAFLRDIFARLYGANGEVMGTRATPAQYEVVRSVLPGAKYDAVSRLITVRKEAAPGLFQRPRFLFSIPRCPFPFPAALSFATARRRSR